MNIAKGSGRIIGMPLPAGYALCIAYPRYPAPLAVRQKPHFYMRHRTGRGVCSMPGLASIDSPLTEVAPTVGPPYRAPIPRIERCHTQTVCGYLTWTSVCTSWGKRAGKGRRNMHIGPHTVARSPAGAPSENDAAPRSRPTPVRHAMSPLHC